MAVTKYPKYADKATFISLVAEGANPSKVATKADVDSWIKSINKIPFSCGGDVPESPFGIKNGIGKKETTFILDRASMKILVKAGSFQAALIELDKLP